jgi:hypothetical protein
VNTQNQSGFKTFTATAVALEAFVRVTIDSNGLISAAGESDAGIGVTQEAIAASGTGTVKLWTAPGTFLIQTAAAVTVGAVLYAAAAGEVDDTGTYRLPLVAGEIAATAQGDMIECLPNNNLTTITGNYVSADIGTIAAAGNSQGTATAIVKKVTAVTAADGTKGVVLPTAVAGLIYEIGNGVNAILKLYPNTSDTINSGSANAAIDVAAYKSARCVAYDATNWIVTYA